MFQSSVYKGSLSEQYDTLLTQLKGLLHDEDDLIANLSNASALLNQFLSEVNWVGFYLWKNDELVLGPFQGMPACVRIQKGRGVCGTSAEKREVIRVEDVHAFPGHIACDAASQSEIVLPLVKDGELLGLLDIDSPVKGRFSEEDERELKRFTDVLVENL
ncbi:GAF domain-containing protein [Alteribacter lacisalsi]|uniref:GAF domain-containing protein n=1 Tax=Alteribacter lacisalsi TaxID=2045244 RepID=A0A2W0HK53_9BACI|nr:GAF domain-containing protein [Alteribacter lacisalsi]PYZ97189.1 GAF domain-containing protein [Alteribacter lacisalsi]